MITYFSFHVVIVSKIAAFNTAAVRPTECSGDITFCTALCPFGLGLLRTIQTLSRT